MRSGVNFEGCMFLEGLASWNRLTSYSEPILPQDGIVNCTYSVCSSILGHLLLQLTSSLP